MKPLRPADPSAIAGYRLLGRLGAGGMGVVYLARSGGGALAALKLIRAEHAADPGFRERFRREARAAERITGRWVVRVLGSDPEAREPWLATEFVPGPSLAEAVGLHLALPEPSVRALGARLADALADMHEAGLVHRDVKPGNVLLALDGPRLIDFGIARSAGATALTATDVMIGTPGFLAPEQARAAGAGEVGPPSDVFSLGCVLAYAATGRRPFGTGGVAAVVYRTVHEEPDLDGVPQVLLPLVTACLAKDPADRPTAVEVRARLGAADGPADDWLPPGLPALIAERSTRALDLPVAEPTVLVPTDDPARTSPSRRRFLALGSAAAVAGAGGLTAWLVNGDPATGGTGSGTGGPPANLPTYTIGVQTDLSGPRAADGRAQERGARLAAETFNARSDRPFDLAVKARDDEGDPRRAGAVAREFVADRTVMAVIGPTTRETVVAAADTYIAGTLVLATVAVGIDQGDLAGANVNPVYREMRVHHDMLQLPVTSVALVRGARRTAVAQDRAAGDYGWRTANSVQTTMSAVGESVTVHQIGAAEDDFGPVVREVLAARPGIVLYAGVSPRRAGLCAKELKQQGYAGLCGGVEYALGPEFLSVAGPEAAEGWYFGTTFVDPAKLPAARNFTAAYRRRWGLAGTAPVDRFAVEAYDVVTGLAERMTDLVSKQNLAVARIAVRGAMRTFTFQGLAKQYGFEEKNVMMFRYNKELFLYRVESGSPRFLGQFEKAADDEKKRWKKG
ncbi:bifunctional serine/threonine-protein kinase/ABC transporter substrate-binding protein [Streptomyces sp. Je 1-79]|uniref:bifunctional serine/threonine-protein kinase/ABC transporter substrate-binding protein n=1 Tax=Streptomyces sp. Je 1-79 TaxID=2943847 RepID=UPI0021A70730|nr:bifunctional serine/threonine-protein kinase/ABC transporter substrate-binding protein [Streptomyces sp. Je 1-79]MCT4355911.1 bifunctional serine/threonine-protein kinase/ABC transporter substrate-binding protein [Streptomyces sp. Je 1-79]